MSHFAVLVITPSKPSVDELNEILMPWHEFECTGYDRYIVDVDKTEELRADYTSDKSNVVRFPDGKLVEAYDPQFYRDPTPEEQAKIDETKGNIFKRPDIEGAYQADWDDGKGYRYKVRFVPEGCEAVEVPTSEIKTFTQYLKDNNSLHVVPFGTAVDLAGEHKYGWIEVDENGEVTKVVDRTNSAKTLWRDGNGQTVALTYSDAKVPFVQPEPARGHELLLDDTGRLVHLLQALHAAEQQEAHDAAAADMAPESLIWPFPARVLDDAAFAEAVVSHLPPEAADADWWVRGGPLSQDEKGPGNTMSFLQRFARACAGQHIYLGAPRGVSGTLHAACVGGSKWDWWKLGGRWTSFLDPFYEAHKDPLNYEPCPLCRGTPGMRMDSLGVEQRAQDPSYTCNGCVQDAKDAPRKGWKMKFPTQWRDVGNQSQKRDIPIAAIRDKAEADAREEHRKVYAVLGDVKIVPWLSEQGDPHWATSRETFWEQPAVKLLQKMEDGHRFMWKDAVNNLALTEDQYAQQARDQAMCPFGFVFEGKWYEKGTMGWWASVSNEKEAGDWQAIWAKAFDEIADDMWLSVCDCHI